MKFEINISSAIAAGEKSLSEHIQELKDATDVWVEDVKSTLDEQKSALDEYGKAVTRQGLKASIDRVQAATQKLSTLLYNKPMDNRSEYSKYIGALKVAHQDGQLKITIDETEYDCIFNDNWDWRRTSKMSNSVYSTRKR